MKKYHSFGKSVMTALLVTILIGATLGCSEVSPDKPSLQSIAVTSPPTKTVYTVGEALDISGIKVTGTYAGGTTKTEPVGESNISEYNKDATGEQTVTVTVSGKTATFTVTVNAPESNAVLQSIAITGSPTKTAYVRGDELDLSGLMVTGTYDDGTTKPETVSLADISGYNKEATGEQTLTVTVGGKTATFTVTVNNSALQNIAITSPPTKVVYSVGEALNLSGLVVTGTYADGTTKPETVGIANVSGYNANTTGTQTLTVTVGGKTATFTVTVGDLPIGLDDLASAAGGSTADNPVLVTVQSGLTKGGWVSILSTIAAVDKYVSLDLSACTMTDTEFDPTTSTTGAEKITTLILPDTAKSIKAGTSDNPTFKAFTALTSISGAGVETVGDYAFHASEFSHACLETVNLPAATSIGGSAFYRCISLETVSLPAATSIGDSAFYDCTSLTSVSLPAATSIGDSAFSNCSSLTTMNLPIVEIIGESVFSDCPKLTTITIAPANTAFTAHNGMVWKKVETTLIAYPSASGDISLPSVITVSDGAFSHARLETVSLPAATSIGDSAFYWCTNLAEVSLPAATSIGDWAFFNCVSLAEVSLPAATSIGERAFYWCTSLAEVSLPAATSIGYEAFRACTGLTAVSLPASLITVGDNPFSDCFALTTITVDPANTTFAAHNGMLLNKAETTLIAYPSATGAIILPSITTVGAYAFSYCSSLTSVSLPAMTSIGDSAFNSCMDLALVSLPATPPSIGNGIFNNTGYSGTITISVPTGAVSAYTSTWGVDAETSVKGSNTDIYGNYHKAVLITDAAQ
jgi:hypothetical protein